jgi:hypothetical protein
LKRYPLFGRSDSANDFVYRMQGAGIGAFREIVCPGTPCEIVAVHTRQQVKSILCLVLVVGNPLTLVSGHPEIRFSGIGRVSLAVILLSNWLNKRHKLVLRCVNYIIIYSTPFIYDQAGVGTPEDAKLVRTSYNAYQLMVCVFIYIFN